MGSRADRVYADLAIMRSRISICGFLTVPPVQYLDVRVRDTENNNAPVGRVMLTVFAEGTAVSHFPNHLTGDLGDAIIRLPIGSYTVRATSYWNMPAVQNSALTALAQRTSVIVNFNVQSMHFYLHVDANRDGHVDDWPESINAPAPAWAWGAGNRGAIIPVNVDNDNNNANNAGDQEDNVINGAVDAQSDIAHIEVRRHGGNNAVPNTWTSRLEVFATGGDANPENNVRIFRNVTPGSAQLVGPGAQNAALPGWPTATAPLVLGMEGIRYAGTAFNGVVRVRLTVTRPNTLAGGNTVIYSEAEVRVASWLMPNHLERADTVYVSDAGATNVDFRNGTGGGAAAGGTDGLVQLTAAAGCNLTQHASNDVWMQDCMELGYSTWPGSGTGIKRMESAMRAYRTGSPLYAYPPTLRGVNFGYTSPGLGASTTFDSTGNLEVTPPVDATALAANGAGPKRYDWGRIYYGRGRAPVLGMGGIVGAFNPNIREFLEGQDVQNPIALNTDWLAVGHVDEMMTFVPSPGVGKGWKLLIASPQEAYNIIGAAPGAAPVMAGRNLHYGPANTTAGDMMDATGAVNSTIPDPALPLVNVLSWQNLRTWNINQVQPVITAILNVLVNEIDLDIVNDVITVPVVFCPRFTLPGGGGLPAHNTAPGTPGGYLAEALTAGMVNMLVINKHLIVPKPYGPEAPVGTDHFEIDLTTKITALNNAMPNAADHLHLHFIDDWDAYHALMGEVHCGTNTRRQPGPLPADVTNWLTNNALARWWEYPG